MNWTETKRAIRKYCPSYDEMVYRMAVALQDGHFVLYGANLVLIRQTDADDENVQFGLRVWDEDKTDI